MSGPSPPGEPGFQPPDIGELPALRAEFAGEWQIMNVQELGYVAFRQPPDEWRESVADRTVAGLRAKLDAKARESGG
jgi:hypothetical protein